MQQRYLIGTLFQEQQLRKKMNANSVKLKDPMGNVRWKGAFTGGFQAGFKNTCGSKQGWVPATFFSTIGGARGEKKQQSIFDFMDKEDLGRETIRQNISMNSSFSGGEKNPFNLSVAESAGERIVDMMKKKSAFAKAPENVEQLHKLLQNYKEKEFLMGENENYSLQGVEGYNSAGANPEEIPDDDIVTVYEDFFRKVIRAGVKQETEEEMAKRREENKIYFDFTRPIEEEPEYLKEIQEIQQMAKPKRRKRNAINDKKLADLFKLGATNSRLSIGVDKLEGEVPKDYDPYHRLQNMREKQKELLVAIEERKKHRIQSINQRSDILSESKLSSKFVSAGSISSTKFVRGGQQQAAKEIEKVFEDAEKNKRYWDYALEMEGKKISAQLHYLSYDEAERQKEQFQKMYQLKSQTGSRNSMIPRKVEEAIQSKNRREVKVVRRSGVWRPQRLLCKRFGCVLPYKEEVSKLAHKTDF